ncbi:prepilin-type N-terminal cleavage/methylation domain-containing protein [bacterium]|nr:prepilin-type N-terminal cleavage/methylation domain-containing protein [bacterium]
MNRERGFTLVELLVAVALLSLIMVAFFTIFKGGTAAWKKGDIRTELVQNGRIALDRMASEIRQALPKDENATPPIYELKVCSGSDTNRVIGSAGDRIIFQAALDDKPTEPDTQGPEEIRFSRLTTGDISSPPSPTNILNKRVDNPPQYNPDGTPKLDAEGNQINPAPASSEITAGNIVTNLTFVEASQPHGVPTKPVLITINLTLEDLEEKDENRREQVTLTTRVKVPYAYGRGVSTD